MSKMGIGDWGFGDWGLGPIPNPQSPIPNPQSPFGIYKILYKFNYILKMIRIKRQKKICLLNL